MWRDCGGANDDVAGSESGRTQLGWAAELADLFVTCYLNLRPSLQPRHFPSLDHSPIAQTSRLHDIHSRRSPSVLDRPHNSPSPWLSPLRKCPWTPFPALTFRSSPGQPRESLLGEDEERGTGNGGLKSRKRDTRLISTRQGHLQDHPCHHPAPSGCLPGARMRC